AGAGAGPAVRVRRLLADAVQVERRLRLARQVEGVGRGQLHAGGKLVAGDAGVEVRLTRSRGLVHVVELRDQLALLVNDPSGALNIGFEVQERRAGRAEARALENRRQESRLP